MGCCDDFLRRLQSQCVPCISISYNWTSAMQFDDIFQYVGQFGIYQRFLCLAIATMTLITAFQQVGINILAYTPDHWCKVDRLENFTYEQQKEIAIPYNQRNGQYERCSMYDVNWWLYTNEQILNYSEAITQNASVVQCHQWTFDQSEFSSTAVTEWNLVCNREWYVPTASSVFVFGLLCGAFMVGPSSDIFGRKKSFFIYLLLLGLMTVACAFSPNVIVFLSLRTLSAACNWALHGVAFTWSMEFVGPRYRTFVGNQHYTLYCVSILVFVCVSYFLRGFRALMLVYSGVCFALTFLWFLVPESPRFLSAKREYQRAFDVLENIAKRNKKDIPKDVYVGFMGKVNQEEKQLNNFEEKISVMAVLKSPVLLANMICVTTAVTMSRLVSQTTSMVVSSLPGSIYLNMAVLAIADIPAALSTIYMMRRLGKLKTVVITAVFASALLALATPFFSIKGYEQIASIIVMVGRAFVTSGGCVVVIMQEELHPTPVKQKIVGIENGISLAITIAGPYLTELTKVWDALPTLIYAFFSICVAISSMLLPETEGMRMPDTITEAELLGRGKLFPWCRRKTILPKLNENQASGQENPSFVIECSEFHQIGASLESKEVKIEGATAHPC